MWTQLVLLHAGMAAAAPLVSRDSTLLGCLSWKKRLTFDSNGNFKVRASVHAAHHEGRGVAWRGVAGVDLILVPGRLVFGHAHGRAMGWVLVWVWVWVSSTRHMHYATPRVLLIPIPILILITRADDPY